MIRSAIVASGAGLLGHPVAPGSHILLLGGVRDMLAARRLGLSYRDSVLLVDGATTRVLALFRSPLPCTVVEACLTDGAGALHIDACRVAWGADKPSQEECNRMGSAGKDRPHIGQMNDKMRGAYAQGAIPVPDGRWPTNAVLVHSEGCRQGEGRWSCVDICPVRVLDGLSGERTSGTGAVKRSTGTGHQGLDYGRESRPTGTPMISYGDTGGASRFFPQLTTYEDAIRWVEVLLSTPDHITSRVESF